MTSITIPSAVTPAVAPVKEGTPTQNVTVEQTASGGIQVKTIEEPVVTPKSGDPTLILGKFKTQADLEAAYKELESQKGKTKTEPEVKAPDTTSTSLNIESAAKVLTDKGLDYNEFYVQYAKDGALNSASYEKLFSKGITAQQIDAFILSQAPAIAAAKAASEVAAKDVMDSVGGKEEFTKLVDFVGKTLPPAEVASYNRAVDAGDTVAAKVLLASFKAQRDAKLGVEPQLNGGTPPQSGSTDTYQEIGQYHNDLKDPRYDKDSFFRNKVNAKLTRSKHLYSRS